MKKILNSLEAAKYLGVASTTLRNSRCTGTLCSVQSPEYFKRGRRCYYYLIDLDNWLDQFPKQTSTSQTNMLNSHSANATSII